MNGGSCKCFAMTDMHIYPAAGLSSIIIVVPAGIDNNNKRDDYKLVVLQCPDQGIENEEIKYFSMLNCS